MEFLTARENATYWFLLIPIACLVVGIIQFWWAEKYYPPPKEEELNEVEPIEEKYVEKDSDQSLPTA